MRRAGGGSIVNISSALGFTGMAERGAYVTTKWALRGLTKTAALELGRYGIRVNSIHPGFVRTRMGTQPREGAKPTADTLSMGIFAIPRFAEPEEITRLVLFVASDEAGYSTGNEFIADGGGLLGPGRALPADPA
jgi:3alpha(or 20beta)-hydroxysteroid dehydrogenase